MATRIHSIDPMPRPVRGSGPGLLGLFQFCVLAYLGLQALAFFSGSAAEHGPISLPDGVTAAHASGLPEEAVQPSFIAQASGLGQYEMVLYAEPAGGLELARIAPGARLSVGGRVRVPTGIWSRYVYWVRTEESQPPLYGFIAVDGLRIVAGSPMDLDLRGASAASFLSPASGLMYSGGESAPVDGQLQALSQAGSGLDLASVQGQSLPAIAWLPETMAPWLPAFVAAGQAHGVAPELLAIIAVVESGGNPKAHSGSGAIGLMQVMPATGADIARQRGIAGFSADQLWDPLVNIDFGAWYLSRQLAAFGQGDDPDWQQSVELAAIAYNGGPGTAQGYVSGRAGLPNETERYQAWVGGMWRERGQAQSDTYEAWWWAGGSRLVEAASQELAMR
jgi:hypothetical protein